MGASATAFMWIVIAIILVLGCFLDGNAIFLITLPIFMKICPMFGIDMVNFGVVMTLLIMIGNLTPPVGMCLFAVESFAKVGLWSLAYECLPYLVSILAVTILCAFVPQQPGQAAGVNPGQRDHAAFAEVIFQGLPTAPVASAGRTIPHYQPAGVNGRGFIIAGIGADIADVRIGQGDDLPAIRRVAEDFLIAGDRSVKNYFALGVTISADGFAPKQAAVFQGQKRGFPQGSLQK